MRAVILCAGRASRISVVLCEHECERIEKSQLRVGNRTAMDRTVEALRHGGVNQITLITRDPADSTRARCQALGVCCVEVESVNGPLAAVAATLWPSEPTVVVFGDTVLDGLAYCRLLSAHQSSGATVTLVCGLPSDLNDTDEKGRIGYGIVNVDCDHRVISLTEKPHFREVTSDSIAFTGVFLMQPEALHHMIDSRLDNFDLWLALWMEQHPRTCSMSMATYYADIGTPRRYLQANLDLFTASGDPVLLGSDVKIGERVYFDRAVIGDGVELGDDVFVQESVVFPRVSVAPGSRIFRELVTRDRRIPVDQHVVCINGF